MEIGAYSTADDAADPDEMERAARYLDMIVGHLTGTIRALWLTPATIPIPLLKGKISYTEDELRAQAGEAAWPIRGIQFPNHATVAWGNFDHPCEIVDRVTYDNIKQKNAAGRPTVIYMDRRAEPVLYVYPVPGTEEDTQTGEQGFTLNLTGQTFSPSLVGNANTVEALDKATELKDAWNLWAVSALAARIGAGPVRKLNARDIQDKRRVATELMKDLQSYENQEHDGEFIMVGFREAGV